MDARASAMMAAADFELAADVEADAVPGVSSPSMINTVSDKVMTNAARRSEP
jgi:hypothetical protein